MKSFARNTLALCCLSALHFPINAAQSPQTAPEQAQKPNIIYILLDDQRYDAFGFMNPRIKTPNMDEIARSGTHFKNAFVTTSLSSPSRASILTGMYAHNHGIADNNPNDTSHLTYFPEKLKEAGYQTGFFGKWHFGGADMTAKAGFAGFDRWVGLLGQGDYYPINTQGKQAMLNIDGKLTPQKGYVTDELTDYAVDWLNQRDKTKPFMMYFSHKGVHADFFPAVRHKGKMDGVNFPLPDTYADTPENYKDKPMWVKNQRNSWHGVDYPYNTNMDMQQFQRNYYETLMSVDDSVGRVQAWLKDNGLDKNTIVMVMGDNGFMFGEHGLIDKRTAYEASIRVPLIATGPGFTGGKTVEDVVANIDIAPTFLDAAGVKKPEHYDGSSIYNLGLDRSKAEGRKDHFVYEYFWEHSLPYTPTTFAIRTSNYKYIHYYGVWDKEELYDIKNDPDEKHNLIDSKDPKIIETIVTLRKQLYIDLKNKQGKNAIPYNQTTEKGQVLRYEGKNGSGMQAASFPADWMRGYDPEDRFLGFMPTSVDQDQKAKDHYKAIKMTEQLINDEIKKMSDK